MSESFFHDIRRAFDKQYRTSWEDAFNEMPFFEETKVRVLSTTPEKVFESPSHPDLPEVSAQVIFTDDDNVPRITIDFYEVPERRSVVIGVSYYLAEHPIAGGFNRIEQHDLSGFVESGAKATAQFLQAKVHEAGDELKVDPKTIRQ